MTSGCDTINDAQINRDRLRSLLLKKVQQQGKINASCAQRRLWLVNQLEQPNASYNILCHISLYGELNIQSLEKSINQLIKRHSVLRTTFENNDGEPQQIVAETLEIALPYVDLSSGSKSIRKQQVRKILEEESAHIFQLDKGALIRVKLIKTDQLKGTAAEYQLVIVLHHIISDGWSMGVITRDLSAIYEGLDNPAKALPPLAYQYLDYSRNQTRWLKSEDYRKQLNFWVEHLKDLTLLNLPTDYSRPKIKGFKGSNVLSNIDSTLLLKLKKLSEQYSVTLNMLLSTAFSLLMYRYSNQTDVVFGSPIANRNQVGLENSIGFFVNMQVIRNHINPSDSFSQLLQQASDSLFSAYANQDVPFENLVDILQPERDRSRNPIFQIVFAFQNQSSPSIELDSLKVGRPVIPGFDVSEFDMMANVTRFDLELHCWDSHDEIRCSWIFDTALFKTSTIKAMSEHFVQLLQSITTYPDAAISSLSMIDDEQRQLLRSQFSLTDSAYPFDKTVNTLFERQVESSPNAIAISSEKGSLTYKALNQKANQLAHYLKARGVKPEVMVGLSIERSLDMIIALLGIVKAGGAYVPLDTEYPLDRLAYMMEDTAAPVLITQVSLQDSMPNFKGETICLDRDWPQIAEMSTDNPTDVSSPDSLLYVIYTSGSTGLPKGVCVEHRSAVRLVKNTNYKNFNAGEVYLQLAPVAFDASTLELWGSLLNGSKLVIYPPQKTSLEDLGRVIQQQKITTLWLTSALFSQMVDRHISMLSEVKTLLAGGEALSRKQVEKYLSFLAENKASDHCLINGYGPTENTTFTTCYKMSKETRIQNTVPIGFPISNTSVFILDDQMNPVPEGIAGELFIGGDGLARGYLNQPELSAEKFISHSFSGADVVRLYRTGDLVCHRDGLIEFIHRMDHQVKVRGYRIELGEVESVIKTLDYVADAVACVYHASSTEVDSQDKQLIAYITFQQASKKLEVIRHDLTKLLPAYMIPDSIVILNEIPLTVNGKINHDALPKPDIQRDILTTNFEVARNVTEETLLNIWQDVLKLTSIGVLDNFFDLGGHSLKATQVISRIRQQMNIELPLSALFDNPSISALALLLTQNHASVHQITTPIPAVNHDSNIPLSFAQERLWFLEQLEPGNIAYLIPFAVKITGKLDVKAIEESLNSIIERHQSIRTRFVKVDNNPVQFIETKFHLNLNVEDYSESLAKHAQQQKTNFLQQVVTEEASTGFDLSVDIPIRVRLLKFSEEENVLLMTMHHIASDGWSLGILFDELAQFYSTYHSNEIPQVDPLSLQYADFACWQRDNIKQQKYDAQLNYWVDQLKGLPRLNIAEDFPRPAIQTYRGGMVTTRLSASMTKSLNALSVENGVTLFMTMFTVYAILLQRYSGQDDIAIGTPIANRNRKELESMIGFFVNMLVLRTPLSGNPDFTTLLKRVQQMTLQAYQHQDLPFEKLVETIQPERDRSRNPLFQFMFVLQNAPMEPLELDELSLSPLMDLLQATRFDIECHIRYAGDELDILLMYNTDLFSKERVERMLEHYQILLESVLEQPSKTIDSLNMMSSGEAQRLLHQWNQYPAEYSLEKNLSQLFEEQVNKTPDAIAIEFEHQHLSYRQLDQRSTQLAFYLQENGIGPGKLVGIVMHRSLDMVIALYATLKSGAAYIPLDPEYPKQRIQYMLEQAEVSLVLTQHSLQSRLASLPVTVFCLDQHWDRLNQINPSQQLPVASLNDLAYVIYTSGSTGKPKGVMNTQLGVTNRLLWMKQHYQLGESDRVLQKTPYSFDVSVWEFFWPLMCGACLVIAKPDGHKDPHYLARLIREKNITTLHFVPSMLSAFIEATQTSDFNSVTRVICSGEALSYHLQQQFFDFSAATLHNLYGPTEAAVDVSSWACRRDDTRQVVPIGHAIANTSLYVLNPRLQPVPVGVTGELYIGGVQVALGYLKQPELTTERFIQDPFSEKQGARLYKTGDLVRYLSDGAIEYIGRMDNQVKLRGLRIELGEIESELLDDKAVKDAIVIAREDEPGNMRLVAYVVPELTWAKQQGELHSDEHVSEWQTLYEETYNTALDHDDPMFNIVSWNSSYSGDPIPKEQMQEWVDETVLCIIALRPKRVLEIGCGTGLLLCQLANRCDRYVGADFSKVAQTQLQDVINSQPKLQHVELWHRNADDFNGVNEGDFDTVIINSVAQYLPSVEYLFEVLEGAVAAVSAGGQIFVGDIRSLPLLNAYHTSVEVHRAQDDTTAADILRRIEQRIEEENELVIDPNFFHALKNRIARLSHVEVRIKHGQFINELNSYRYNVILHIETEAQSLPDTGQWIDWGTQGVSETALENRLATLGQSWLGVNAIPNLRVSDSVALWDQLHQESSQLRVADLHHSVNSSTHQTIDPFHLKQIAEKYGFQLELNFSETKLVGSMNALFRRNDAGLCDSKVFWLQEKVVTNSEMSEFATNPLKGKLTRKLVPQLKQSMKTRLPEYMVPSVFVLMDSFPLSVNGKIDRHRLPVPGDIRLSVTTEYTAPRNEIESTLTKIWMQVLKLDRIGVNDDFFDLGGHSLLATQVISRLREQMEVDIPLSEMFGYPTVNELAQKIEMIHWANQELDENLSDREEFKI